MSPDNYTKEMIRVIQADEDARAALIVACVDFADAKISIKDVKACADKTYSMALAAARFEVSSWTPLHFRRSKSWHYRSSPPDR